MREGDIIGKNKKTDNLCENKNISENILTNSWKCDIINLTKEMKRQLQKTGGQSNEINKFNWTNKQKERLYSETSGNSLKELFDL